MEYIYKIENLINHKVYVGLTNNPSRRKTRHFYDLSKGQHDNPHLQKAYDKYGLENFKFEVIQEYNCSEDEIKQYEKYWIKELKAYGEGYNCNPGGDLSYNPGKLSKEEVFQILSVTDKMQQQGAKLAKIYGVSIKVISNVNTRKSYARYYDEYQNLPQDEKERLFVIMNSIYHFKKEINKSRRLFSREQVYMIYIHRDYNLPFTLKSITDNFGMDDSCTPFKIKSGKIYKDYYEDYFKLNINDKNKVLCHYIEIYNEKPFELLETPNVKSRAISSQAAIAEGSTTIS